MYEDHNIRTIHGHSIIMFKDKRKLQKNLGQKKNMIIKKSINFDYGSLIKNSHINIIFHTRKTLQPAIQQPLSPSASHRKSSQSDWQQLVNQQWQQDSILWVVMFYFFAFFLISEMNVVLVVSRFFFCRIFHLLGCYLFVAAAIFYLVFSAKRVATN